MNNIFITGESGTIPLEIEKQVLNNKKFNIVNCQFEDKESIKKYKKHRSFSVREPEIDFLDRDLLFNKLDFIWKKTDIIIHSGAFVGTDFCQQDQQGAIRTNVEGTHNIVDVCNKYNIRLVYFSTTAIFDPDDYSDSKPILESTNIRPRTIYGITKYAGEQIVDMLCETDKMIIRPVFGFGNHPKDLHSALIKVINVLYYNHFVDSKTIDVLLNTNIEKSYIRVENLAKMALKLIENDAWHESINIGEPQYNSFNWKQLFEKIQEQYSQLIGDKDFIDSIHLDSNSVNFIGSLDYLHYHNICDDKLRKWGADIDSIDSYVNIDDGIYMACKSVIKNN